MSHYSIVVFVWLMLGVIGTCIEWWFVLHGRHDKADLFRIAAETQPVIILGAIAIGVLGGPIQIGVIAGSFYWQEPGRMTRGSRVPKRRSPGAVPTMPVVREYRYETVQSGATCERLEPSALDAFYKNVGNSDALLYSEIPPKCGKPAVAVMVIVLTDGTEIKESACEGCTASMPVPWNQ